MEWKLGWVTYKKRLNRDNAVAYIKAINQEGKKRYKGIRATEASERAVFESIERNGEFVLCLIPTVYFAFITCGNHLRIEKIREFFRDNKNRLSRIPPVVVGDYKSGKLVLLDGTARSTVAYEQNIPLLGYVPEELISVLKGVTRL